MSKQLLLEYTRRELAQKSKTSDKYSSRKDGSNRWSRRAFSKISARVINYRKIDMNKLFREDKLQLDIEVSGETNDYIVTIRFNGVIKELQRRLQKSKENVTRKDVERSLQFAFNTSDLYVHCTCEDWKYRQSYHATQQNYNAGKPENRSSDKTNPNDTKGAGCKHINLVIANYQWIRPLASVIFNYIEYIKKTMRKHYDKIIAPALYGKGYKAGEEQAILSKEETKLQDDPELLHKSNIYARDKGRFKKKEYKTESNT